MEPDGWGGCDLVGAPRNNSVLTLLPAWSTRSAVSTPVAMALLPGDCRAAARRGGATRGGADRTSTALKAIKLGKPIHDQPVHQASGPGTPDGLAGCRGRPHRTTTTCDRHPIRRRNQRALPAGSSSRLRDAEQRGDRPDPFGGARVGRDNEDRVPGLFRHCPPDEGAALILGTGQRSQFFQDAWSRAIAHLELVPSQDSGGGGGASQLPPAALPRSAVIGPQRAGQR